MYMQITRKLLAVTIVALAAQPSFAADPVKAALRTLDPHVKVTEIRNAPIAGYKEVNIEGQIVYISNDGKYLLQGMIFDIAKKQDLTEARRSEIRRGLLAKAPSDKRIVFKPEGPVKNTVTIFTDIDCGYCRKLHEQIADYGRLGIQVEYLMYPRAGVGSDAYRKAVAAWCADNQQDALTKAKAGEDPGNASCDNPVAAQYELGKQMGVTGTPTIVLPDGSVTPGYVAPAELAERLAKLPQSAKVGS